MECCFARALFAGPPNNETSGLLNEFGHHRGRLFNLRTEGRENYPSKGEGTPAIS